MVQFLFNNVITIISQPQDVDLVILSTRLLSCNLDRFKHDALFSFGYNHPPFFLLRTPSQLQCILNIQPQDVDLVISTRLPNRNLDMTFYFPLVTRPPPLPPFFFFYLSTYSILTPVYTYILTQTVLLKLIYINYILHVITYFPSVTSKPPFLQHILHLISCVYMTFYFPRITSFNTYSILAPVYTYYLF